MTNKAPIALFVYNRPDHTLLSLESLLKNEDSRDSELFIFCDGPKNSQDEVGVERVAEVVKRKLWCGKVNIIRKEKNEGLAKSVIQGVTKLCNVFGRVIVLEDDLILSPYFLTYMNTALDLYSDTKEVMQISGYMFPVDFDSMKADSLFLKFSTSWGWATWQRAWQYFDPTAKGFEQLSRDKKIRKSFDLNGSYPYFDMLKKKIDNQIDSWAIIWYLNTFMQNALTLYPKKSLVKNIGFDNTGTHCGIDATFDTSILLEKIATFPSRIEEDQMASNQIYNFLRTTQPENDKKFLFSFKKIFRRLLSRNQ